MPDNTLIYIKKTKLIEIYNKIINIKIEEWKNETNERKKEKIQAELFEFIDILDNTIA